MMTRSENLVFLVAAAGRGTRMGADIPKQYRDLAGIPVLTRTLEALLRAEPGATAIVSIHAADRDLYDAAVHALSPPLADRLLPPVLGGPTRQATIRLGLEALAERLPAPAYVLIHDAARPFGSPALVAGALAAARRYGAAVPGVRLVDTVKQVDADGQVLTTLDRNILRHIQTPQVFAFPLILDAHRRAAAAGRDDLTDDAAVAEWAGHPVQICEGDPANMKITTPEDIAEATRRFAAPAEFRTGQGFDVHAFGPGDHVWLGGVAIPHDKGLVGHSDADVLLHAITDALLGAIADGDIGQHFPPSDPRWKGAASSIFLTDAARRVRARGGAIAHIDATIICEEPKIGPHREAIRASIATMLALDVGRVAVKATTTEHLGFTGRREGIAVMAIATIALK